MEILKEKLKRLQSLMIEYSSVNISRDDLKLEVERKRIANESQKKLFFVYGFILYF